MNILDRLLQIVAVEVEASYLDLLKRIADEPEALYRELGREQSAILLKDLYDLCVGNEESQQFLLSTDFAKLISGERKIRTGEILVNDNDAPREPEAIDEEYHQKAQTIVTEQQKNLDEIQKEN